MHRAVAIDQSALRAACADARGVCDGYWIFREVGSETPWRHAGHAFTTRHGDLLVGDVDAPFESPSRDGSGHEFWLLPKARLDPHLPSTRRPLAVQLFARRGIAATAAFYLDAVARSWSGLAEPEIHVVADTLCRLVGAACAAVCAEAAPDGMRAARLAEAKRHIERRLAEPGLSPASVAAALRLSPRALHLLFEATGGTFARHVLRRRLDECRAALLASPARPVVDIAFAWGFSSLSSFYRNFHSAFGASPTELRRAARGGGLTPARDGMRSCAELVARPALIAG